ncbi:type IV secretion system protein VirB10 (plasmid) [Xylella taiwanensis]|uniref:Type IV secretion system protein VirB10 n=1 Tax=Xylella taiwanensis TaxID=1444770 RepID=A0ABS8TVL9_9GAMM|nr:type IV secretion system protein VirB10 [Xylella taiwanensis]MCD8459787.1 type IV secretion system protein VirB10 [Xylella taiwanensis]MCD8474176.1 type IV secretion system protein VirB10 [Xylella taiwanensis]UFN08056.1 type IV secretion system protein VirB10 [Xylella taiwanensis]UFN10349.1 type IV secretion system protein VirB10 [Xylella taiwanensis]UFN12637.1 type IV secretion system protein VirB10 [Xylella taiwanensis]
MSKTIDVSNSGALPTLDAKTHVLGAPTSYTKSKTNVGKFFILGLVLLAFLFVVAGLLFYQKYKSAHASVETVNKSEPVKPEFAANNAAFDSDSIEKKKEEIKKKQEQEQAQIKAIEEAQAQAKAQAEAQAAADAAKRAQGVSGQAPQGNQPPPSLTPMERKMAGGVLLENTGAKPKDDAKDKDDAPLSEKEQQQREVQARMAAMGLNQGGGQGFTPVDQSVSADGLAARLQPTVLQARSAGKLPNLNYLLKRGTSIPCALKTGIDTTLPGFVMCNVLNNVYSANGKVLLIERGATVFGEQQSQLKQGQERTFVVWTRIDNPNGVFANIDSPATDQMGYSGIPGYVDTHFWQRFGGAIMLSLIKDFSQAYSQRVANRSNTGNSGATVTVTQPYANTTQATQDMAAEALRNSINIPPTLVVLPATTVNVMVARDVSFENVFNLVE